MKKTITEKYLGAIPLEQDYQVIDVYIDSCKQVCQNCGRLIKNVFVIKGKNNKCYNVGSECVLPLTNDALNLSEYKRILSRKQRLYKFIKQDCKTIIINTDYNNFTAYIENVNTWSHFWKYRGNKEALEGIDLSHIKVVYENNKEKEEKRKELKNKLKNKKGRK